MEGTRLVGSEIHGFRTMEDLDVVGMMEEAKSRWLRPNEIHAILCNHKYFTVNVKPKNLPKSGTVVLFDRKMLRNFRKDGHNWKKKKDGKTVKEAHEHLKVGNVERIHVYYAHGEDTPTFVRRCYWLLDKSLEHIVLVHYRETQEGSPATSGNSNSCSGVSDPSAPWHFLGESDSAVNRVYYTEQHDNTSIKDHEKTLHEINTLDWEELLVPEYSTKVITPQQGQAAALVPMDQYLTNSSKIVTAAREAMTNARPLVSGLGLLSVGDSLDNVDKDNLQSQDSFGRWMNTIIADSPESLDEALESSSISTGQQPFTSPSMDNHLSSAVDQIFNITDISPSWALSTEPTKVLVVGFFNGGQLPHTESTLHLACGDSVYPVQAVQAGVFRSVISPQTPGLVNLYLTYDGHQPISQVFAFEVRAPVAPNKAPPLDDGSNWDEFRLQMRLAQLLFSSSKKNILNIFSNKASQITLKEANAFAQKTAHISNYWGSLSKMIDDSRMQFPRAKDRLLELALQNRLQEWLLEKILAGSKISERDERGQGVIHLCAILGYTWAVLPFSCSNLSMDYRDKFGWTALHWAAYYGREKMVAALLSAGAKPYLVTDPTSENPSGCTPADLASRRGFEGLAAYLAEKALVAQFADMTVAGNLSGSLQTTASNETENPNLTDDESLLKDTLAAYRTAAGAAARIQEAFREHSLKIRTKAVEEANPEKEARSIVAAMKIQHAFRNYETKKKMGAATRIQCRFRTWKIRQEFLNLRRQAIKIQAVYRGFQARKQYRKVIWSVGVLEKAILRWRLKRKGLRGLQVESDETLIDPKQENDVEEDFFRASRKQAEERVERSVINVQAMFRSKRAQEEYRRMKLEHNKAKLEYEELLHPDAEMG